MATTEDVVLRYAISQKLEYEVEVINEASGEVLLESSDQPQIRVTADPDQPWCSCDEDAVPGTCTHVLYLAGQDHPISKTIIEFLEIDLDLVTEEVEDLFHTLEARKQEKKALSEALQLLQRSDSDGFIRE